MSTISESAYFKMQDELARLRAERDALRKDAERYRWLRERALGEPSEWEVLGPNTEGIWNEYGIDQMIHDKDTLDEAIDAALAKEKKNA